MELLLYLLKKARSSEVFTEKEYDVLLSGSQSKGFSKFIPSSASIPSIIRFPHLLKKSSSPKCEYPGKTGGIDHPVPES
jgi:hypothetical protein